MAGKSQFSLQRLNADGSTDASFGTGGTVNTAITTLGDAVNALALQADGKIIAAGRSSITTNSNFALARYQANGALDTSFADGGRSTVDFFSASDSAESALIQPDGKIVLGGVARDTVDGYGLARFVP